MSFPKTQRVIYNRPALEMVLCQLRFPPILRIGAKAPVDFQEKIRSEYPLYKEIASTIPGNLPPELAHIIPQALQNIGVKDDVRAYDFFSDDQSWQVSLTQDFMALKTTEYKRWENFRNHLESPLATLHEVYKPSYYSRIGLRYRDVIVRSKLGLNDEPWANLLQPQIAGELSDESLRNMIKEAKREILIDLDENIGQVRVRHFLAPMSDSQEQCYVIDADFFTEQRTELNDASDKLDKLNKYAGSLFKWCITEQLYNTMEPKPVV